MKSLKWKFVLMYVAVVFIAMLGSGTYLFVNFTNAGTNESRETLYDAVRDIRAFVLEATTNRREMQEIFQTSPQFNRPGLEFYVLSATVPNATYATSVAQITEEDLFFELPSIYSSAIISASRGETYFFFGRHDTNADGIQTRFAEYAAPFYRENSTTGELERAFIMYARMDVRHIFNNVSRIMETVFISLLFALAGTVALGIFFATSLTKPLAELTKKTREFGEGKFADGVPEEIPVYSDDETGQLTESFNLMARHLAENMSEIVRQKNRNEIVLFNMTDGVLAYDAEGDIVHCNNACYELLNFSNILDMDFNDMLEALGIQTTDAIDDNTGERTQGLDIYSFAAFENDVYVDVTLFINDRYLNAVFNPYKDADGRFEGVIIVLQDVTRHKKLDNMRKEFVANVSHEIRTPITTIMSYSETLLDGAVDDRETAMKFLTVINNEADKMTRLVTDLLELSKSDDNRMDLRLKEIDLCALVSMNVEQHKVTAKKLGKTITFKTDVRRANVNADPDRISQVLNNIISNSFKYSGKNASVAVTIEAAESYYRVNVRDNGMGIPKEDLPNIFERFYRVDKARSRAMGGTGLGLSIAQEIMEAHGGKISAISEFGKGTTMILRFPMLD